MKKLLLTLILFPATAFAHNPAYEEYRLGWMPDTEGSGTLLTALALDSASTTDRMLYTFTPSKTCTLDKVHALCVTEAASGGATPGIQAGELSFDLFLLSSAIPAPIGAPVALELSTNTADAVTATWLTAEFNTTVTQNLHYGIEITNDEGTPTTNNCSFYRGAISGALGRGAGPLGGGWGARASTDGGSTYTAGDKPTPVPFVIEMTGTGCGTEGLPISGLPTAASASIDANEVYADRKVCNTTTTPSGVAQNFAGCAFIIAKKNAPTGALRCEVYEGTTLVKTSSVLEPADITTTARKTPFHFTSTLEIAGGTTISYCLDQDDNTGNTTDGYGVTVVSVFNDAEALTAKPNGVSKVTYNGTTWDSATTTEFYAGALIEDNGDQYGTPITSGGKKSTFNRGFN